MVRVKIIRFISDLIPQPNMVTQFGQLVHQLRWAQIQARPMAQILAWIFYTFSLLFLYVLMFNVLYRNVRLPDQSTLPFINSAHLYDHKIHLVVVRLCLNIKSCFGSFTKGIWMDILKMQRLWLFCCVVNCTSLQCSQHVN